MTILFPFVGDTIGGSHLATIALIKKLSSRGIKMRVVLHEKGPLAEWLDKELIPYDVISFRPVETGRFSTQIFKMSRAGFHLRSWLKEEKITIVHTNDLRMHYTWLWAAKLSGCKHIWHQHSHAPSIRLWLYMALPKKILTISDYALASLPPIYRYKTSVIYNDFDDFDERYNDKRNYHRSLSAELGLPDDIKIIGFVGNLTAQKRPDFFLDMASEYASIKNAPPACFLLIGGPRPEMQEIVEQRLSNSALNGLARYIGPRFPVEDYIAAFDVLVAPSLREGLGRVPLEAMLLKTPVIASRHGGHMEIIQHGKTGILFNPNDPSAAAQELARLLGDPEKMEEMAIAAHEYASRTFTGETYLENIIEAYSD